MMGTIQRFEDIEAWQKARELTRLIYEMSRRGEFARDFALKHQIRRASVSVMSNIAEGFDRSGTKEFRHFLSMAKASASEVRSQLYVALDAGLISEKDFQKVCELSIHTGNLIGAFMRYLKGAPFSGTKHLRNW